MKILNLVGKSFKQWQKKRRSEDRKKKKRAY